MLNVQIAQTLAQGKGRIHGVDASEDMIANAKKRVEKDGKAGGKCSFQSMSYLCRLFKNSILMT